jgi:hypothetical protein
MAALSTQQPKRRREVPEVPNAGNVDISLIFEGPDIYMTPTDFRIKNHHINLIRWLELAETKRWNPMVGGDDRDDRECGGVEIKVTNEREKKMLFYFKLLGYLPEYTSGVKKSDWMFFLIQYCLPILKEIGESPNKTAFSVKVMDKIWEIYQDATLQDVNLLFSMMLKEHGGSLYDHERFIRKENVAYESCMTAGDATFKMLDHYDDDDLPVRITKIFEGVDTKLQVRPLELTIFRAIVLSFVRVDLSMTFYANAEQRSKPKERLLPFVFVPDQRLNPQAPESLYLALG